MKFKILIALVILFIFSSPAYSTPHTLPSDVFSCPLGTVEEEEEGAYRCKLLEGNGLLEYCAKYNYSTSVLLYCERSKGNLKKIGINTSFKMKINETVHIESKNATIRLENINNTEATIFVLDHFNNLIGGKIKDREKNNIGEFYLTLREISKEGECPNCDRLCPDVCVKLWELRKKDKFSDKVCMFNECGSGCGADGINSFSSEEECKSAFQEQISNADTAVFYIEDIPKDPNLMEVTENTMPIKKSGVGFYLIGGALLLGLIIKLIIKINWK